MILYLVVSVNWTIYINEGRFFLQGFRETGLDKGGSRKPARGIDWSAPRRAPRPFGGPAVRPRPRPARRAFPLGMGPMKGAYFMSQFYLNGPSAGYAMSAEEFAAGTSQRPGAQPCPPPAGGCGGDSATMPAVNGCGCGCGGTASDCPSDGCGQSGECCQQVICCCRPAAPAPKPPQVEEGCCCKQSFRSALGLLCDQQISSLLDFDLSAFLTCTYSAGATLEPGDAGGNPTDNLADTLSGSFRRFSPCSCDLIDVDAPVYNAAGTEVFTATQISLCKLDALVIQAAAAAAEGDLSAEEVTARNFRCLRTRLAQRLNPCGGDCGQTCTSSCSCACDSHDCCCAAGLLATLAQNNLSRRVSLVAGLLVLNDVTLLGAVGNVLVLANDTDNRLYFVCVNSVQFIG